MGAAQMSKHIVFLSHCSEDAQMLARIKEVLVQRTHRTIEFFCRVMGKVYLLDAIGLLKLKVHLMGVRSRSYL